MANIALCWELGAGLGHLLPLAEFAKRLSDQHDCLLISRNIASSDNFSDFDSCEVVQAPYLHNHQTTQFPVFNYSGLMRLCGYDQVSALTNLVDKWLNLFISSKTELVISDHSPTALLAAYLLDLPTIMTGNGFSVPPPESPCPSLRPWELISDEFLAASDAKICATINASIKKLGAQRSDLFAKPLNCLSDLFARSTQWVAGTPDIDHYRRKNKAVYIQTTPQNVKTVDPVWDVTGASGDNIFLYSHYGSPALKTLFEQLLKLQRPCLAVVPHLNQQWQQQLLGSNIKVSAEFVDIVKVSQQCKTIINHGGLFIVEDFLNLGIPSIMIPDVVERTLLAYRVGAAGLGFAGSPDSSKLNLEVMLSTAQQSSAIWENAKYFSTTETEACNLSNLLEPKLKQLGLS